MSNMDKKRLRELAGINEEVISVPYVGTMEVETIKKKFNEYLEEFNRLNERAQEDPYYYFQIHAMLKNGMFQAMAEALGEYYKD